MKALILVAGGSGQRMGTSLPKQYLELGGKAIIQHSLERFLAFDPNIRIILVLSPSHQSYWDKVAAGLDSSLSPIICKGGKERFDSVSRGLEEIPDGMLVGIHDAVRPLVSVETIRRCYAAAEETGSGIPVLAMDESVRQLDAGNNSRNLERATLRRVQTPQTFRSEEIKRAYQVIGERGFTDDASVYEAHYGKLNLVEGNQENIKITTATDLKLASLLI